MLSNINKTAYFYAASAVHVIIIIIIYLMIYIQWKCAIAAPNQSEVRRFQICRIMLSLLSFCTIRPSSNNVQCLLLFLVLAVNSDWFQILRSYSTHSLTPFIVQCENSALMIATKSILNAYTRKKVMLMTNIQTIRYVHNDFVDHKLL